MLKLGLLGTKFHYPSPPAHMVTRPLLVQRLSAGLALNRPLTLVSAPAGFGKTSCVGEWMQGLDGWPVAWLSLDTADDDPGRFFAYLITALQKLSPKIGQALSGMLQTGQLPPAEAISTTLINDILELEGKPGDPFLLILDDFHVIQDPLILRVLQQMLDNMPPQLHLILITREDPPLPLARLRASNRLTEIRAYDLRFSRAEAERFLNERLGLALSPADVIRLEEKTEGWIAGLQLVAIALQGTSSTHERFDSARFIDALSGSHRYILDYLTEQVLDHQPPGIRNFLLQTAVLNRLHGDLCDAITGRDDSHSLLERLLNANLFLIPLDDKRQWYRYHHLFADLLRSHQRALPDEERAGLHLRASHWFTAAGMTGEAIDHALAAEEYAMVIDLLETHAREIIGQGYAKTVHSWLQAVPVEWRSQSTRTDLAFAWMHLLRGAYTEAAPYLEQAKSALSAMERREEPLSMRASLQSQWLAMRSLVLQMEGKLAESKSLAGKAVAIAPEQDAYARSLAYFALGSVLRILDEISPAIDAYRKAMQQARLADNPVAELLSTVGLAGIAFERGRMHLAAEITEPVIARLERSRSLPPITGVLYGILGEVHYQWHQLEEAQRCSRRALELSTLGGYKSGRIGSQIFLSRLAQLKGDLEAATHELRQVADLIPGQLPDYVRQELIAQQVRLYLARNQPEAAWLVLQGEYLSNEKASSVGEGVIFGEVSLGLEGNPIPFPEFRRAARISHAAGLLYNSYLRFILYRARAGNDVADLRRAVEWADDLLAGAMEGRYLLVALETLLLRAQIHTILRHPTVAAADYAQALNLAEPEGIVTVFIEQTPEIAEKLALLLEQNRLGNVQPDYIARIISLAQAQPHAHSSTLSVQPEGLVEPLSERELDVLHLIAEGQKYKEIAAALFISVNTVRFHVKAIYSKLGVNNRAQAVDTARRLRIF